MLFRKNQASSGHYPKSGVLISTELLHHCPTSSCRQPYCIINDQQTDFVAVICWSLKVSDDSLHDTRVS